MACSTATCCCRMSSSLPWPFSPVRMAATRRVDIAPRAPSISTCALDPSMALPAPGNCAQPAAASKQQPAASARFTSLPFSESDQQVSSRFHRAAAGAALAGAAGWNRRWAMSGVRVDDTFEHLDLVAGAPCGGFVLGDHAARAVLEAHRDLIALARLHMLLDLVADHRAADRADDGRDLPAVAVPDLVARHAADHGSAHRADAAAFALRIDLIYGLDHPAFAADR